MLPALGVEARHLSGKHGPCPICREGRDRFRFDDKEGRGTFICSVCGAGSGIDLVMKVNAWDFREAARRIEAEIGTAAIAPAKPQRSEAQKRDAMNALWRGSRPIARDDAAGRYLSRRVGLAAFPPCLRTCSRALYIEDGRRSWWPALVAMLSAPDGTPAILHRTFLTPEGQKAPVVEARKMMPGTIPKGSALRLADHDGTLGISEGIENAYAASSLFGVPCWAATNATLLAQFEPPADVRELIVFGDNDPKFGGAAAAYALAHRLAVKGRKTSVEIPSRAGSDWNDVLNEERP